MKIKARLLMILLLFVFEIMVYAAPKGGVSTEYFEFDASKMDVGNMYHYVVSDIDGNYPMDTFVYVKSQDTLVIYQDYPMVAPDQGLVFIVEETFDWDYMMMEQIYAYNPLKDLTFPNQETESVGQTDFSRKVLNIKAVSNDKRGKSVTKTFVMKYENEPFYDYSLFHIDLQFAMRHLVEGTKEFSVGNTFAARYNEMIIKYVGDEMVENILCRKYEHKAQGVLAHLLGARGYIWLAKEDPRHYGVKYTSHLRRNMIWKNFGLQLKEIKQMDLAEWEAFLKEMVDEANRFFGMD